MGMTTAEFYALMARTYRKAGDKTIGRCFEQAAQESDLHQQIIDHCRRQGWYYVHSRMDKPNTNGIGTPDFVIFMDCGRVACIECKRKGSKPTTAQLAAQAQLRHLGHRSEIVYSYEQFVLVIQGLRNT